MNNNNMANKNTLTITEIPEPISTRGRAFIEKQPDPAKARAWLNGVMAVRFVASKAATVFGSLFEISPSSNGQHWSLEPSQQVQAATKVQMLEADPQWQELDREMRPALQAFIAEETRIEAERQRVAQELAAARRDRDIAVEKVRSSFPVSALESKVSSFEPVPA